MTLNEADTRARLIDPRLEAAQWGSDQISREHYYRRDVQYTPGRIVLRGTRTFRKEGRKVDYLLRYADFPIAVVEAKAEGESAESGFRQGQDYACDLGIPFAYATNGHDILEYDAFTRQSRDLPAFPTPAELWQRWITNTGLADVTDPRAVADARALYDPQAAEARRQNPLLHPYCPESITGKTMRYFQESAVARVLERIMRGQQRILLTMATGTGKTFTAFQVVWKLLKSRWLHRRHLGRPARVLFLADRVVLRDQAYNAFAPFASEASDPRFRIGGREISTHFDLYFGIYQTLWTEEEGEQRLYERFPPDFFDLVIIDEAHRSGFGTWREILDYFGGAIHLGMTATPKRTDNVDTYAYFCQEEPELSIDPDDPARGTRQPAAFEYSLGQGIEDGFLATYKVHRVRSTVDKEGLHLQAALESGAEVLVPEEVEARELYTTPQFEREITLPDRTRALVDHLAGLLRRFGPEEKTMVFCVDTAHAQLAARLLNDAFAHLGYGNDYAVPIVAEEGEDARRALRRFQDSDQKLPVVATTAELLSTGVDVPACRNIVFMKTVSSTVLFKQILGRGSRIDPATGKYWFRIIDYTGATRLFDAWDRPPLPPEERPAGPETAQLTGKVVAEESGDLLVGASVAVLLGPNAQRGPIYTGEDGTYAFAQLPAGAVTLVADGPGFRRRQLGVELPADATTVVDLALKPAGEPAGRIRVRGLDVTIADESIFLIEATGQSLSLQEYEDYTRRTVRDLAGGLEGLREAWARPDARDTLLEQLMDASIHPDVLAEVEGLGDADCFDLLAHLAFGAPVRSRDERVAAFRNREQRFLQRFSPEAREVILALLEKYRAGGVEELANAQVFRLPPFDDMGQVVGVTRRFGDVDGLRQALHEVQQRLYAQ